MRFLLFVWLYFVSSIGVSMAQPNAPAPAAGCGEVVTVETHSRTTTRYVFAQGAPAASARKLLARQSVFDLPLQAIKTPVLVIGHAADNCERSPAAVMENITARSQGIREQVATVAGGPTKPGRMPNLSACEVREPHDFVEQELAVAAGIERFLRGGSYSSHPPNSMIDGFHNRLWHRLVR